MKNMKPLNRFIVLSCAFAVCFAFSFVDTIYTNDKGKISFVSKAPLEVIKAESNQLNSVIDVTKRTFAFSVLINSFEGFNAPLQKEHFRENYMESEKFPKATFKGKIIEDVDLTKTGVYNVRAKGLLNVHGVEKDKIINAKVTVAEGKISLESVFTVTLEEINIRIPKVVNQKIAPAMDITVKTDLSPKK